MSDDWTASVNAEQLDSDNWVAVLVLVQPAAAGLTGAIRTRLPGEFPTRDLAETVARAKIVAEAQGM